MEILLNKYWIESAISYIRRIQKWPKNKIERADLLFKLYSDIQKAYDLEQH
jgi:hypothetical protein